MSLASRYDVAVIGAGIAGLATCVRVRKAGLSVVCLDGQAYPHRKVGESLDWSSPGLLERVGIDVKGLLADEIATYKKNIVVYVVCNARRRHCAARRSSTTAFSWGLTAGNCSVAFGRWL